MRRVGALVLLGAALLIAAIFALRSGVVTARTARGGSDEAAGEPSTPHAVAGDAAPGVVVDDETGAPVPGAHVTLFRVSVWLPEAHAVRTFVTDDSGAFSVPLLQEEGRLLVIEAEGYPPQSSWIDPDWTHIRLERGAERAFGIVDAEGRPAAGAEVDVFADEAMRLRLWSVEADAGGVATLPLTGNETLLVRLPGHAYESIHRYGPSEWPTEVTLVPEYTIGGRIVDSGGQPIQGASVRLRQGTDCETFSAYGPAAATGRDGRFLFHGIHGLRCELTVRAAGYVEGFVVAASGDERIRVVMRRAATASGVVVMPDGSPAAGAEVRIDSTYEDRRRDAIAADAQGRFELTDLAPHEQEIVAFGAGDLRARLGIAPAEGETLTGLRLELRPPGTEGSFLRVQVVDERGRAIPGAALSAHNGRGTTDRDGLATLDTGAPPGFRTTIVVKPPAEEPPRLIGTCVPAITSARPDGAPALRIVLHDGVFVRVEARAPDGTPVTDASVSLFRDGIESGRQFGNPDEREQGSYVDPFDTYLVRVRADGFALFEMRHWSPRTADGLLAVTLRPCAAVKGRVADAEGVPLDEVHATVDFNLDHMGMGRRLECGPGGIFQIEGLEEGAGMLTVGHTRGDAGAAARITTVSGQVTDVGTLVLAPHVALAGRVVDADGSPVGGAHVTVETGLPDWYESTYSRADGTFRIVAPGFTEACLVLRKAWLGTVRLPLARGAAPALGDITLPAPGALDVEVEGIDWMTTEYLAVEVAWEGTTDRVAEDLYSQSDPRPYRVHDLAPGRYLVRLSAGDMSIDEEVRIVAGESARVTFRLGGGAPPR